MNEEVKPLTRSFIACRMNRTAMPRKPMYENDELVPKQVSLPLSMKRKLKQAAAVSGKTESGIVRDALVVELAKTEYKDD